MSQTPPAAAAARRADYARRTRRTRRLLLAALLAPVGAWLAIETLSAPQTPGTGATDSGGSGGMGVGGTGGGGGASGAEVGVRAYLTATGIFARPQPEGYPAAFAAAEAAATEAGAPLAFSIWTDTPSFDAGAWRELIQVGRVPALPPPAVDFGREVAVLVWPAAGAPAALRQAPGLVLRGAVLQHTVVEVRIAPARDGAPPATPAGGGDVLPYALVTIPRRGWPIPAPAPSVPPLTVALVA